MSNLYFHEFFVTLIIASPILAEALMVDAVATKLATKYSRRLCPGLNAFLVLARVPFWWPRRQSFLSVDVAPLVLGVAGVGGNGDCSSCRNSGLSPSDFGPHSQLDGGRASGRRLGRL